MKKLDDLVTELIPTCSSKFFTEASIRQHIIDTLAERRRQVKKGYDYSKVSKDLNVEMTTVHNASVAEFNACIQIHILKGL